MTSLIDSKNKFDMHSVVFSINDWIGSVSDDSSGFILSLFLYINTEVQICPSYFSSRYLLTKLRTH